jgi:hypothetical protein
VIIASSPEFNEVLFREKRCFFADFRSRRGSESYLYRG